MHAYTSSSLVFRAVWIFSLALASVSAHAATPYLVKDVDPSIVTGGSSTPNDYVTIGDVTFFVAEDLMGGRELFKSDGTEAGTAMVKDIEPGSNGSYPTRLVNFNGVLYFFVESYVDYKYQLWKSDGTADGTVMVKQLGYAVDAPTAAGNKLFFSNSDDEHGAELWVSDGTAEGTGLVTDICPGVGGSSPTAFKAVGDRVYFSAGDTVSGFEPWVSDGTPGGTFMLAEVYPGSMGSDPANFTQVGSDVFFTCNPSGDTALWKTQGTTASTVQVKNFMYAHDLVAFGGKLYFSGYYYEHFSYDEELWASDGTDAGTVQLKDLESDNSSRPRSFRVVGSTMYFVTCSDVNGVRLWVSDGTALGTTAIAQVYNTFSEYSTFTFAPRELGGQFAMVSYSNTYGGSVWVSDGTPSGTANVYSFSQLASSYPSRVVSDAANGRIIFTPEDNVHGAEPFVTDGTTAGTHMLKEIIQYPAGIYVTMQAAGGRIYFVYDDGIHGEELWCSDGTEAGTHLVKDINPGASGSDPVSLVEYMHKLYFVATDGTHGFEIWSSDGTSAGTAMVADLVPGPGNPWGDYFSTWLFVAGNKLFFQAATSEHVGLWVIDGNQSPAFIATMEMMYYFDLARKPMLMCDWNGRLCLTSMDAYGPSLWFSDGTAAGTSLFARISASSPTPAGSRLYFVSFSSMYASSLYVTDGTVPGTVELHQFPGAEHYSRTIEQIKTIGGRAFLMFDSLHPQLWTSDGTSATTVRLDNSSTTNPLLLMPLYDQMYFQANGSASGRELWRTDGTTTGTQLFCDINPGTTGSSLGNPVLFNNAMYFTANDGVHGGEIWSTDGIAGHTQLVCETLTGVDSVWPSQLTPSGRTLFFLGSDHIHGNELWALPADDRIAETFDIPAGDSSPIVSTTTSLTVDFGSNSAPGRLTLSRFDGQAPGRSGDVPGYWLVSGLPDSEFSVALIFNYDAAEVASLGFTEADLRLIRSTDGGATWIAVASTVDEGANTIRTTAPQSTLGLWAITTADRLPSSDIWVNFIWSGIEIGTASEPFNTMLEAIAAVGTGGTIKVNSGVTNETPRITKTMRIEAVGGPVRIGAQ